MTKVKSGLEHVAIYKGKHDSEEFLLQLDYIQREHYNNARNTAEAVSVSNNPATKLKGPVFDKSKSQDPNFRMMHKLTSFSSDISQRSKYKTKKPTISMVNTSIKNQIEVFVKLQDTSTVIPLDSTK
jgi:hypothetical protein